MKRSFVEQVMGLPVSVLLRGGQARSDEAAAAVARLYTELRLVDAVFSTWRPGSEISRLGRAELDLSACSQQVREVARLCGQARDDTGGLFDAQRPDGSWDPSGLVKGWAVERACRQLAALPLDWCVNAGGDVLVRSSGRPFAVGIQDPLEPDRLLAVVALTAGAVATSGTAARGNHLWDPRTGGPAAALASVTVVGPTLAGADVLATAAFVSGGLELLADRTGVAGLAVHLDGRQEATANWSGETLKKSG